MVSEKALEFRFDGGASWLNLLGTQGQSFGAHPVERLPDPGRLAEWLAAVELAPDLPPDPADLASTRALREALRAVALATVADQPPPAEPVETLRGYLRAPEPLLADPRLRRPPPATTADALARIAAQAVDHLTSTDRHNLAVCAEHDCRWVFLDTTGRRRWCPSPACASRGRVRALRARRRTEPS
ncbi:MAG TPA: CGNR zinc finger domain-containing protein [Pseudonocardia sp.]